jgi:hypothetical protein
LAEIEVVEPAKIFDLWFDIERDDFRSDFNQLASHFSAVIGENYKEIDYLPRQYIAEYIKNKGADGIKYVSYQSSIGKNIVLFSKEKANFIRSRILYNRNTIYSFHDLTFPERTPLMGDFEKPHLPSNFHELIKSSILSLQTNQPVCPNA